MAGKEKLSFEIPYEDLGLGGEGSLKVDADKFFTSMSIRGFSEPYLAGYFGLNSQIEEVLKSSDLGLNEAVKAVTAEYREQICNSCPLYLSDRCSGADTRKVIGSKRYPLANFKDEPRVQDGECFSMDMLPETFK